jgi:hypothetical protein
LALFAKVAASTSETAPSVVWSGLTTGTSGTPVAAAVAAFTDLDNAALPSLVDVTGTVANGAASTSTSAGGNGITTVGAQDLVLSLTTRLDDVFASPAPPPGFAAPPGFTRATDALGTLSGSDFAMCWAYQVKSPAGAIAAPNFVLTGASSFASSGVMIALKGLTPPDAPLYETSIDNFNRANGLLDATGNWVLTPLAGGAATDLRVISNQLGATVSSSNQEAYTTTAIDNSSGNCDVLIDCAAAFVSGGNTVNLSFLITNPGTANWSGYRATLSIPGHTATLTRIANGSIVDTLARVYDMPSAGDQLWFCKRGSNLRLIRIRGGVYTTLITATDANHNPSNGVFGIALSTETNSRWDNLRGGPLVAAGTSWTATPGDTIAITDTVDVVAGLGVTIADPVAATDIPVTVGVFNIDTLADTAAITDARATLQAYAPTLTDTAGVTDLAAAGLSYASALTDTAGITDQSAPVGAYARVVADPAGVTDTPSSVATFARVIADPAAITDLLAKDAALTLLDAAAATDTAVTDLSVGTVALTQPIADTAGITDTPALAEGYDRTIADTAGITDVLNSAAVLQRILADPAGITDTAGLDRGLLITDPAGITDTLATLAVLARLVADIGQLTDAPAIQATGILSSAINDTASITDAFAPQTVLQQVLADPIAVTDLAALGAAFTILDAAALTDTRDVSWGTTRALADTMGIVDALTSSAATGHARSFTDALAINDALTQRSDQAFTLAETLLIADLLTRRQDALRELADTITISDLIFAQRFTSILMRLRVTDGPLTLAGLADLLLTRALLEDFAATRANISARPVRTGWLDDHPLTRLRTTP